MKIAFVLNDLRLSGGVNVVLQHASRMAAHQGDEVFLLLRELTDDTWFQPLVQEVTVVQRERWAETSYDIVVATYWETLLLLGEVPGRSYVWFCQLYEDRFFPDRNPSISTMQIAGSMPLPVVTEANWLKNLITSENPDREVEVVLNGIDKTVFRENRKSERDRSSFAVLVEGSLDALAKNTSFALDGSLRSSKATTITHVGNRPFATADPRYRFIQSGISFEEMANLYRTHHIQVKTPLAEGMFGPPLEGFHCGLPAIVTPVTGAEEYVVDGENSVVVLWDDAQAIGATIDRLALDGHLWKKLQDGARATASTWPEWVVQSELFRESLVRLARHSKLTQSDLGNLGRTIQFADMMHWLAMRRLSDKSTGPRVLEELMFGKASPLGSISRSVSRRTLAAISGVVGTATPRTKRPRNWLG